MNTSKRCICCIIIVTCFMLAPAQAEVPRTITYQGSLKQANGTPITDTVSMSFALYDTLEDGTGTLLWSDTLEVQGNLCVSSHVEFGGNILGGKDNGLAIYPNTNAWDSRAWIAMWGDHTSRAGELALAGTYVDLVSGSTTDGYGKVGLRLTSAGNVGIGTTTREDGCI